MNNSIPDGFIKLEDFASIWRFDPELVKRVCESGELISKRLDDGKWVISFAHVPNESELVKPLSQDLIEVEKAFEGIQQSIKGVASISQFQGNIENVAGVLYQIINTDDPGITKYIHYLAYLITQVQSVSLDYIDHDAIISRVLLSKIFVHPYLNMHLGSDADARLRIPQNAITTIAKNNHFILLGDVGAGKSTFTRYLTLCLAGEEIKRLQTKKQEANFPGPTLTDLEGWPKTLALCPIYIELPRFANWLKSQSKKSDSSIILDYLASQLRKNNIDFYDGIVKLIFDQKILIVFDGLDEIPEAQGLRNMIQNIISNFSSVYNNAYLLVTARPYVYKHDFWKSSRFKTGLLAQLNDQQIGEFIDRWFSYMSEINPDVGKDAIALGEGLKKEIYSRSSDLINLARNPLLLTFLASLRTKGRVRFPDRKAALYNNLITLMMQNWERNKIIYREDGSIGLIPSLLLDGRVPEEKLFRALEKVAFVVQNESSELSKYGNIPGALIAKNIHDVIYSYDDNTDFNNEINVSEFEISRDLNRRIGILLSFEEETIPVFKFPHSSFQEFLAARYLCGNDVDFPVTLVGHVKTEPEKWWNVFLFAIDYLALQSSAREAWRVIEELSTIDIPEPPTSAIWKIFHLIGKSIIQSDLHKNQRKSDTLINKIRTILIKFIESGNMDVLSRSECGDILSELEDTRPGVGVVNGNPNIQWIHIPQGSFMMGSDPKFSFGSDRERPFHRQEVKEFSISKYPITNQQFDAFYRAGGYTKKEFWSHLGWSWKQSNDIEKPYNDMDYKFLLGNHPRVGITWFEAYAFCKWLTKELLQPVRLPTEAEWEKAAKGVERQNLFPWGDDVERVPLVSNMEEMGIGFTNSVGIFPEGRSDFGCLDMSGNILEWCSTVWSEDYKMPSIENPESQLARCVRGGAYNYRDRWRLHVAYRRKASPGVWNNYTGFRVAS